jgi:hypothetical protein
VLLRSWSCLMEHSRQSTKIRLWRMSFQPERFSKRKASLFRLQTALQKFSCCLLRPFSIKGAPLSRARSCLPDIPALHLRSIAGLIQQIAQCLYHILRTSYNRPHPPDRQSPGIVKVVRHCFLKVLSTCRNKSGILLSLRI